MHLINSIARSLQSRRSGIPSVAVKMYRLVAIKLLSGLHEIVADEVKSLVKLGGVVLDVGCGTGSLLAMVCRRGNYYLVGLDISEGMINEAKGTLSECGCLNDLVLGDAHRLPFRSSSVDITTCTGALHHMREPRDFFNECYRVIKKGCKALIYEFSPDSTTEEFKEVSKRLNVPVAVIKLVATLHGVPRREFTHGHLRDALKGIKHEIINVGAVTEVLLVK